MVRCVHSTGDPLGACSLGGSADPAGTCPGRFMLLRVRVSVCLVLCVRVCVRVAGVGAVLIAVSCALHICPCRLLSFVSVAFDVVY